MENLLSQAHSTATLSFSETDFAGEVQSASSFWLQKVGINSDPHKLSIPSLTRWDQIQRNTPPHGDVEQIQLDGVVVPRLSASSMEKYAECPFSFAAKNLFGLQVAQAFDLEVDAMTKGRLVHHVLDRSIADSPFAKRSVQELETFLDQAAQSLKIPLHEPLLWRGQRRRLAVSLIAYLEFEIGWRQRFPRTQTVMSEARFHGVWNIHTDQWRPHSKSIALSEEEIEISGGIDRVDQVSDDKFVVLDYKTSGSQATASGSWISKGKFQLWLYMQALRNGLVDGKKYDVAGAFYIDVKGRSRSKGYVTEAAVGLAIEVPNARTAKKILDSEGAIEFDRAISQTIRTHLLRMKEGHVSPIPSDEKTCTDCDWRTVCRAKHLMI